MRPFHEERKRPRKFDNRGFLFNDGDFSDGFIGIIKWTVEPNNDDPYNDYVRKFKTQEKSILIVSQKSFQSVNFIKEKLKEGIKVSAESRLAILLPSRDSERIGRRVAISTSKREKTRKGGEEENEERGGDCLASATFCASGADIFAVAATHLKERFKAAPRGLEFAESDVDESALEFLETNLERESKSGRKSRRRCWKEAPPDAADERVSLARIPRDQTTGANAVYFWTRVENGRRRYR